MALDRNVGLKGFRYRGGLPMLSWPLHRIRWDADVQQRLFCLP